MKVRSYGLLCTLLFGWSLLSARNPKLLFNDSTLLLIRNVYNSQSTGFPFDKFKAAIVSSGSVSLNPVSGGDAAGYDETKALLAKTLAFRYAIEANADTNLGSRAYYWLATKYAADNYVYQSDNWALWMVNSHALSDYCIAFDILCGAGYFDRTKHPFDSHDQTYWDGLKQAEAQRLRDKAAALYNRVKNFRTVGDAATALIFGPQTTLDEAKFHAQVGNHRIMVASGLGVAAYLLADFGFSSEAALWLAFAKKDVEQFLFNRPNYPVVGSAKLTVASQNVQGAFPEGISYLNYSGIVFIPFMIANRLNGGEDYFQDENYKKMMDWCYDLQLPDGSAPQINATDYNDYPINSLSATVAADGPKYLGQLRRYVTSTSSTVSLPVEAMSLISSPASALPVSLSPITSRPVQGELIMRNDASTPTRYLLVSAKHDAARYAAELHAYADAGSYIFQADGRMLVLHPGYAGYSNSRELEIAKSHSSICPVVHDTVNYDSPNRDNACPSDADAWITNSKHTDAFSYGAVTMEVYGAKPVTSSTEATNLFLAASNYSYDYGNSLHMTWKNNGDKYGTCDRKFILVNNAYLIVRDDITRTNTNMQYAVSFIQGNNGNNLTSAAALATGITTNTANERVWSPGATGTALRVNTAALGGKVSAFSTLEAAWHQASDPLLNASSTNGKYYHAALKTACGFTANYGQMVSILEPDPSVAVKAAATTKLNADSASYLLYTVDGRGKQYGRFDIVFSQKKSQKISLTNAGLPFPIETDAAFLIVSCGADVNDTSQIKIFSNGATYVRSGSITFVPSDSGDAQTAYSLARNTTLVSGDRLLPSAYELDQNFPNPFNPSTTIRFGLPAESRVRLEVINILGQVVGTLVDGVRQAGWVNAEWNSHGASGLYFYRLQASGTQDPSRRFVQIRKMMLVK
jgi:hypothetical protein